MTTVTLTVPGLSETLAQVQAAAARARDLSPVLPIIAQQLATATDDSFRRSQDFTGAAFAPNAPSTIKRKKSSKPDIDTSAFRGSISARPVGRSSVSIGTNTPYAGPVIGGFVRKGTRKRTAYKPTRPKGSAWSVTVKGRNPFPFTLQGSWIDQGRGAALRSKITATLAAFVATGRLG